MLTPSNPQLSVISLKNLSKKTGLPYQSLIDYVLKDYAKLGLEPTANWEKATEKKSRVTFCTGAHEDILSFCVRNFGRAKKKKSRNY